MNQEFRDSLVIAIVILAVIIWRWWYNRNRKK